MYVLSLENYPKYDLQATTSHRAVQRWCPFNTTHNLWKSTLGKKNTGCVVRIGWKVATLDLRKGHLSKQMSLLLQEAKQNLAKSKESVARTSPLRKRSHFLVIPPAYFLVCIAPASNSQKASPVWRFPNFYNTTQDLYPNSPQQPRCGRKVRAPQPETEGRRARRSPPGSRASADFGIAARRPLRWSS